MDFKFYVKQGCYLELFYITTTKNSFVKTLLKAVSNTAPITKYTDKTKAYKIPIAHGEGRYYADNNTIESLLENDQVIFQYCNENAEIKAEENPNGSIQNIAGVSNETKNVMGMMPHPERAVDPLLGNTDGVALFESLLDLVNA